MSTITIDITKKNLRKDSAVVQDFSKWAKDYLDTHYPSRKPGDFCITIALQVPAESRAARLNDIANSVDDAREHVEELRDELQEWLDNLPENLQESNKAGELQEAVEQLETISRGLEDIDWDVQFPSMMG